MKKSVDTIIQELNNLVQETQKTEKHIGYHIIPDTLVRKNTMGYSNKHVFYEKERLDLFKRFINFENKKVLDIGCNMGYFLFEYIELGASKVVGYEGKTSAAKLAKKAIELMDLEDEFEYNNAYFDFKGVKEKYDVISLLNVLHHLGDDYGSKDLSISNAKNEIIKQLNGLSSNTNWMIFQLGFNWQGNIKTCLFENGLKSEMIDFISKGVNDFWEIVSVSVPEKRNGEIVYNEVNSNNIERIDELGEFLNRPIFILKSKIS